MFVVYRYGELQGLNKVEIVEKFGNEKVKEWCCSYDIFFFYGESFEMCVECVVKYFVENVRIINFVLL